MTNYRFVLEPYKGRNTRYTCPVCGAKRSYSRYLDSFTGNYLPEEFGRCNKQSKCAYHLNPYKSGYAARVHFDDSCQWNQIPNLGADKLLKEMEKPVSFIHKEIFYQSLQRYDSNNFVSFLISEFGVEKVNALISRYCIGTASHWPGATVFWQKDVNGNLRTGKIMLYSPITGRRVKEPYCHINWVHRVLKVPDFSLRQCLFGEHLLKDYPSMRVGIVESEKTAIICSIFEPEYIWLAAGSLGNLSEKNCEVLKDREGTLFPDMNAYGQWSQKAEQLRQLRYFKVSDFLEKFDLGIYKEEGWDLADFYLKTW